MHKKARRHLQMQAILHQLLVLFKNESLLRKWSDWNHQRQVHQHWVLTCLAWLKPDTCHVSDPDLHTPFWNHVLCPLTYWEA
jgi:hypothetical protein